MLPDKPYVFEDILLTPRKFRMPSLSRIAAAASAALLAALVTVIWMCL